ncbi:MAG: hypothetical protein LBS00_01590 [Synergistaceae bacterium]|nr:hypothetical protein [Synergistaceae bacterium]
MRKILFVMALLAAVAAMLAASDIALADGRRKRGGGECGGYSWMDGDGWRGARRIWNKTKGIDVPQEIREKWAEAQKIKIDLRTELGKTTIDRAKALELHAKHRALVQEISDWRFLQRLNALGATE